MFPIPAAAEPLAKAFEGAFTQPTFKRFMLLVTGLIVTIGRRTVSRALRVIEPVMGEGHWCNYHRIYSQARYRLWDVGRILIAQVIALLPADAEIILVADDTVDEKTGEHVWAKGPHRDGSRSTRNHVSIKWGHKWLVMCVLVKLPGIGRPWALPILCGLCRTEKVARQTGCRRKSPSELSLQFLIRPMRWFPDRRFILLGDSRATSHRLACFAHRHSDRVTLISRLRSDANLYAKPSLRKVRGGGLARKGRKLPAPVKQVPQLTPQQSIIAWYGSSRRKIRHVSETGLWYSVHQSAVVPIRWVCVLGSKGKGDRGGLEDAYFYSSRPDMDARRIVELYAMRWNIEVTFEESRALLGLETTRHWCKKSVLRATPILMGLFTAVGLIWNELSASVAKELLSQTPCYRKQSMTFSDVLYLVRREIWSNGLLQHHLSGRCDSWLDQLPQRLRNSLLTQLAAAA
jgi:DDE superfamily endonuclease